MRVSLRELVAITAVIATAVPALYFANPVLSGVVLVACGLTFLVMLGRALELRGAAHSFATAFLIAGVGYVSVLLSVEIVNKGQNARWRELDPYDGSLPTTRSMLPLLQEFHQRRAYYIDPAGNRTQKQPPPNALVIGGLLGSGGTGWRYIELPTRADFMAIAHCLWTLLFGWLAGKHAAWLYRRRVASEAACTRGETDR